MQEEFRKLKLNENYSVSNLGNVRNDKTGQLLKQYKNKGGYLSVSIPNKNYRVHRLVGFAFIPNPENKPCIDHIDNNRSNNNLNNLRWVTHTENNCNMSVPKKNKIGVKGVYWNKIENLWEAKITYKKWDYHLGFHRTKEEAIEARQKKANELFGEYTNKSEKQEITINLKVNNKKNIVLNINIEEDDEEYKALEKEFDELIK